MQRYLRQSGLRSVFPQRKRVHRRRGLLGRSANHGPDRLDRRPSRTRTRPGRLRNLHDPPHLIANAQPSSRHHEAKSNIELVELTKLAVTLVPATVTEIALHVGHHPLHH